MCRDCVGHHQCMQNVQRRIAFERRSVYKSVDRHKLMFYNVHTTSQTVKYSTCMYICCAHLLLILTVIQWITSRATVAEEHVQVAIIVTKKQLQQMILIYQFQLLHQQLAVMPEFQNQKINVVLLFNFYTSPPLWLANGCGRSSMTRSDV